MFLFSLNLVKQFAIQSHSSLPLLACTTANSMLFYACASSCVCAWNKHITTLNTHQQQTFCIHSVTHFNWPCNICQPWFCETVKELVYTAAPSKVYLPTNTCVSIGRNTISDEIQDSRLAITTPTLSLFLSTHIHMNAHTQMLTFHLKLLLLCLMMRLLLELIITSYQFSASHSPSVRLFVCVCASAWQSCCWMAPAFLLSPADYKKSPRLQYDWPIIALLLDKIHSLSPVVGQRVGIFCFCVWLLNNAAQKYSRGGADGWIQDAKRCRRQMKKKKKTKQCCGKIRQTKKKIKSLSLVSLI